MRGKCGQLARQRPCTVQRLLSDGYCTATAVVQQWGLKPLSPPPCPYRWKWCPEKRVEQTAIRPRCLGLSKRAHCIHAPSSSSTEAEFGGGERGAVGGGAPGSCLGFCGLVRVFALTFSTVRSFSVCLSSVVLLWVANDRTPSLGIDAAASLAMLSCLTSALENRPYHSIRGCSEPYRLWMALSRISLKIRPLSWRYIGCAQRPLSNFEARPCRLEL